MIEPQVLVITYIIYFIGMLYLKEKSMTAFIVMMYISTFITGVLLGLAL